jgi:hypothetical protein
MEGPGRYRRAFEWRLTPGDREATSVAAGGLVSLFSSEMPEVLEDYLSISRKRRNNRLALARLQAHLLDELSVAESTIKHYKAKKKELEDSSETEQTASAQGLHGDDLKLVNRELFLWRAFSNVIRAIADGIAWRALDFDRAVLRALCQNRGSQTVNTPGTVEELREWSRQFDYGDGIAILNSLTNWLTYGDVTVVNNDGSVTVSEVKSSKTNSNRVVRQKQKLREVVTFLSSGKGLLEGKTVEVRTVDLVPENGLDALCSLLQQTDEVPGYSSERISNSVYVECVDFRVARGEWEAQLTKRRESAIADWIDSNDHVHTSKSLDHLGFSPNMAPFTIFPFPPTLCIDLLTAAKAYVVFLNVTAIAREFRHRGWEVETMPLDVIRSGNLEEDFMTVKKERFHVTLPPAVFMRMQMELLRPKVVIRQCELLRRAGPGSFTSDFGLPIFEHEREIWD